MSAKGLRRIPHRRQLRYSITWSARASRSGGTARPSAFAVLRLMTNSYFRRLHRAFDPAGIGQWAALHPVASTGDGIVTECFDRGSKGLQKQVVGYGIDDPNRRTQATSSFLYLAFVTPKWSAIRLPGKG